MRVMSTWEDLLVRSRFSGKGERAALRFCFCSIFRTRSASKSFNHRGHRGPLAEGQKLHHEGHEGTTTKGTKEICFRFRLPFMSLRFRRQRLLAKPADHDLLRLSTGEGLAFEVAKFVDDLEPLRAHQQVQFPREEAAHVQIFDTKVWLQSVRSAPAEVPLDAAHCDASS